MPYATQSDMTERFGADEIRQLTDRSLPALGAIDSAVLDRALTDADGLIDSHLGTRYTVPLSAAYPADIVRVACEIARYFLYDLSVPELVRQRYDDAVKWLKLLADGKATLIGADGAIVAPKGSAVGPSAVAPYLSSAAFGDSFAAAWLP